MTVPQTSYHNLFLACNAFTFHGGISSGFLPSEDFLFSGRLQYMTIVSFLIIIECKDLSDLQYKVVTLLIEYDILLVLNYKKRL